MKFPMDSFVVLPDGSVGKIVGYAGAQGYMVEDFEGAWSVDIPESKLTAATKQAVDKALKKAKRN